jgi:hypothetical protein
MDSSHNGSRGRATTQMRVIILFSSKEMRNLNAKEKRIKRGAWIVPGNTDASISVACCSGSPNHQMYDQTTTAPKWRKTNRRNNLLSWNRLPGVGKKKTNKTNKQTNKISHTWSPRLQAKSYSSHHHQKMHKTTSEPKKKPFNRRRKTLLELQFFLSVDWYKQQNESAIEWASSSHTRPSPTRTRAHTRAHTKRWHKTTKSPTEARTIENGSPYVYVIVNTVHLLWRK